MIVIIPKKTPKQRYIISITDQYYTGRIPLRHTIVKTIVRSKEWKEITRNDRIKFWNLQLHHRVQLSEEYWRPHTEQEKVANFDNAGFGFSKEVSEAKRFNKISSLNNAITDITNRFPTMKLKVLIV